MSASTTHAKAMQRFATRDRAHDPPKLEALPRVPIISIAELQQLRRAKAYELRAQGWTLAEIGVRLGITKQAAGKILRRYWGKP